MERIDFSKIDVSALVIIDIFTDSLCWIKNVLASLICCFEGSYVRPHEVCSKIMLHNCLFADTVQVKCKAALQEELGLPVRSDCPLVRKYYLFSVTENYFLV